MRPITIANDFLTIFLSDKSALLSPYEPMSTGVSMTVTEWLRAKFIGKSDELDSSNALLSDLAKNSEQILWLRVNDLVKGKNNHFAEARAENLAQQTIKIACEKTQSAELAKCAAEAELERVKGQIGTIMRQLAERMERANKAEASLTCLQAEILAKTVMKKLVPRVKAAA